MHNREGFGKEGFPNIIGGVNRIHPAESADFRGLASPLHDAELSEALARLIARMRKLSAIGKPWAMTERLQLTTEIGTLFLGKILTKNIALSKIFCCVSTFFRHAQL